MLAGNATSAFYDFCLVISKLMSGQCLAVIRYKADVPPYTAVRVDKLVSLARHEQCTLSQAAKTAMTIYAIRRRRRSLKRTPVRTDFRVTFYSYQRYYSEGGPTTLLLLLFVSSACGGIRTVSKLPGLIAYFPLKCLNASSKRLDCSWYHHHHMPYWANELFYPIPEQVVLVVSSVADCRKMA